MQGRKSGRVEWDGLEEIKHFSDFTQCTFCLYDCAVVLHVFQFDRDFSCIESVPLVTKLLSERKA